MSSTDYIAFWHVINLRKKSHNKRGHQVLEWLFSCIYHLGLFSALTSCRDSYWVARLMNLIDLNEKVISVVFTLEKWSSYAKRRKVFAVKMRNSKYKNKFHFVGYLSKCFNIPSKLESKCSIISSIDFHFDVVVISVST